MKSNKKNFKSVRNNSGFSLMEMIITVGLLGVVALAATSLMDGISKNGKNVREKNSLLNLRTQVEAILGDNNICTNQFRGTVLMDLSADPIDGVKPVRSSIAVDELYTDATKSAYLLKQNQKPTIIPDATSVVSSISVTKIRKLGGGATDLNGTAGVVVSDAHRYAAEVQVQFMSLLEKPYDPIIVGIVLQTDDATVVTRCSSNALGSIVQISATGAGEAVASCAGLNNSTIHQTAVPISGRGVCSCPCPTCAGGVQVQDGFGVMDVAAQGWRNACSSVGCTSTAETQCIVGRL